MSNKSDNRVLSRQLARDLTPQELQDHYRRILHKSEQRRDHHVLHARLRRRRRLNVAGPLSIDGGLSQLHRFT